MKSLLFLSAIFVAGFGATAVAEECITEDCQASKAERKSSDNYDDGNAFEAAAPAGTSGNKSYRSPSSNGAEMPYSDDEIKKNAPENFPTKNMPVDQD